MGAGTAAGRESVNAFPVREVLLFKHYFEGEAVFDRLKPYYNGSQYRFEVDVAKFDSVRRFLRDHGYDVSVVDRPERYWVVVRQYTAHPDDIFKQSVRQERAEGYNCFLLTDQDAVETAVSRGGTRLTSMPFSLSTGTLEKFGAVTA